jgi:hypothetical protein
LYGHTLRRIQYDIVATMVGTDPRRVVGGKIKAKAMHVTNAAEAQRRYGSLWKKKWIAGVVVECEAVKKPENQRLSWYVLGAYDFGEGIIKRKRLNMCSVKILDFVQSTPPAAEIADGGVAHPTDMETEATRQSESAATAATAATTTAAATSTVDAIFHDARSRPPEEEEETETETEQEQEPERARVPRVQPSVPPSVPPSPATTVGGPTAVAHEMDWFTDDAATLLPINGTFPVRTWSVRTLVGSTISEGSDKSYAMDPVDYFLLMFPPDQLEVTCRVTNQELNRDGRKTTTTGEILKLFGVLILLTRFEFTDRASLWSERPPSKYVPPPCFGRTGMSRNRFDELMKCLRWCERPDERPPGMSSEKYRWMLIDGFVERFNGYRAATFTPSERICVDESMSRWYGQGGDWINHGLPMYVAIDRKPENGCEIQNAACGESGVMLQLKLVKTAREESTIIEAEDDAGLNHGTVITKELVKPWFNTDRIVCADSYFASVATAKELKRCGLRFIGVVKTATKRFPLAYLSALELHSRGDRRGLVTRDADGQATLLAFVWMDRNRRYFIASGSSLQEGLPYSRDRWRQVDEEDDAPPERVRLQVKQPKAAELYYSTCGSIDQHNRHRQDTLMLERKVGTHDWAKRVNLSIFGMIVVDTYIVHSKATGSRQSQKSFYQDIATALIDNNYDRSVRRSRGEPGDQDPTLSTLTGVPRSGVYAHLTPTKKRRKSKGVYTKHREQGNCRVCKRRTTYICSVCEDDPANGPEPWLCHTERGNMCFSNHMQRVHPYFVDTSP